MNVDNIFFLLGWCYIALQHGALSLQITSNPPVIDVPTYSLATKDINGQTGMNILTYASPVSIKPDRIWTIGLYKGTVAHENFSATRTGVLQLMMPCHAKTVQLLGGSSGRDVDKRRKCRELGFPWMSSDDPDLPDLLPDCACYLQLKLVRDLVDFGSHDVAMCKVESTFIEDGKNAPDQDYLSTAMLREMGIITEQGRVAV